MLKKSTLGIIIASTIFSSTLVLAAEQKTSPLPLKDVNNEVIISKQIKNSKVKTMPEHKKNDRANAYELSMTTIIFKVNENVNLGEDFLKIDNDLKESKNLNDVFSKYGKITKVENKVQSLVAGYDNSFSSTRTIEYVSEVTNGIQSHGFIDITNYQNIYINDKLTDNKLALFLNKKDSQLDALNKVEVNDGSQKTFIERPVVSTHKIDQTVVLKTGEYKLINLSDWTTDESPLFNNVSNKTYRAIVVKVLSQGT